MMQKSAIIGLLLVMAFCQFSFATEISGPLSGTLPLSGSPYQVVGDIYVPMLQTLVIEPGVVLDFQGYYCFKVGRLARLDAIGTESDSIIFTCDTSLVSTGWKGVEFDSSLASSSLQYCRVEHSKDCGIQCTNSSPHIAHCLIRNNWGPFGFDGRVGSGIGCYSGANPVIENNTLIHNSGFAIAAYLAGATITGNVIKWNWGYGQIHLWQSGNILIRGNDISENHGDDGTALIIHSCSNVEVMGNTITYNEGLHSGEVIQIQEWSTNISFKDNLIAYNFNQFISVLIKVITSEVDFSGNIIINNYNIGLHSSHVIAVLSGGHINMVNNIIANNELVVGISIGSTNPISSGEIENCIIRNLYSISGCDTCVTVSYSNIQGGWPGEGNIDVEPLFRDTTSGDYHLMSTACGDPFDSPCIDAGSPQYLDDSLSCAWGLGGIRSDMGAFGGRYKRCIYAPGDANGSGIFNGIDVTYSVNYLKGIGSAPDFCDCPPHGILYASADANGNCVFNGIDVTYSINYLKGLGPSPSFCLNCPSEE